MRRRLPPATYISCIQSFFIYLVLNHLLTSVLVKASAMMAALDPPPPPGKDGAPEKDFRPDLPDDDDDDDDDDDLPQGLATTNLRLHVHFSF